MPVENHAIFAYITSTQLQKTQSFTIKIIRRIQFPLVEIPISARNVHLSLSNKWKFLFPGKASYTHSKVMPKLLSRSRKVGAGACLLFLVGYFINRFRHSIDFIEVS